MTNRKIAGVAAGLSDFFGIDLTLIRVLFVLSIFFTGGAGPLIYLLCWMVVPQAPTPTNPTPPPPRRGLVWIIVVIALVAGIGITIRDHYAIIIAAVVLVAAVLIWRKIRGRGSWKTHKEFEKARLAWQRRLDEQARQAPPPTYLGGDPFQIGSFYPQPPPPSPGPANPPGPADPSAPSGFQPR